MRRFPRTNTISDRGFTLLELMIVLALLALLMALAWPALRRPLLRSVTQQAARQLAEDLGRARLNAIDSQQTMVLRYEPGGGRYRIEPSDMISDDEESGGTSGSVIETTADADSDELLPADLLEIEGQFEDGVSFADPLAEDDDDPPADSTLGKLLAQDRAETEEVKPLVQDPEEQADWSPPIMIYPTGRAENARFLLQGPDGYRITVTLRGLTGAVAIGAPVRREQDTDQTLRQPADDRPPESSVGRSESRDVPPPSVRSGVDR